MLRFNVADAKSHFPEMVQKALIGEDVVIAEDDQPILRLVPIEKTVRKRKPGSAKGKILFVAPDFNEPLEDFSEYS